MTKKILVAENDEDILFILNLILNNAGYKVETLQEGSSLVNRKQDWPDLFILDKDMPTIDGLALCKYLRLNPETRNKPIIMMSAYHKVKQKAADAGADEFITKPFDLKDLLQKVGKYANAEAIQRAKNY
jgi:CheY-like chemotaxis protein